MLVSFNTSSISVLTVTAPIYQSVEETLQEKTRKSNAKFILIVVCVTRSFTCLYVNNTFVIL